MKKSTKIALIVAAALIVVGIIVCLGGFMLIGFNFSLFKTPAETKIHTVEDIDSVNAINISSDTSDVKVLPSSDGKCRVECVESQNLTHTVSVKDGVLAVTLQDTRKWYDHIRIYPSSASITLYLTKTEFSSLSVKNDTGDLSVPKDFKFNTVKINQSTGDVSISAEVIDDLSVKTSTGRININSSSPKTVKIQASTGDIFVKESNFDKLEVETSTGDITVKNSSAGDLILRSDTGDVEIENCKLKSISSTTTTGEVDIENVIVEGATVIDTDTGDVELSGFDSEEITVTTDTGDISGYLLSDKVFIVRSDTGKIRVPESISGGKCKITTDTGDVIITVKKST